MSAVDYRRALHRIPELDNQLPETVQLVQRILAPLPCRVFSPITGSVCAWFDAGKSDAVAFRAELDALPVTEATDLPYASVHPGRMHACGHDAHTAMVLTLAEYAAEHLAELPRNVLFLFQPSEETTGGAGKLCESGVLERYRVRRIFGLHLWPGLEAGTIASRPGPLMARSNEVTVTVEGRSVHMSRADEGLDALTAGISYLQRAYDMLIHDVAIDKLHVVLGVDRAGLVGEDGETHHGVFDPAFLDTIPGMTVLCPSSFQELREMLRYAIYDVEGPVAVRYSRGGEGAYQGNVPVVYAGSAGVI